MRGLYKTETELAKEIITYLHQMDWEIYKEVQFLQYGNVADIVATQNNLVWILECKLSLSLSLIAQAERWKFLANYISIVVPIRKHNSANRIIREILKHYGIGCYEVGSDFITEWVSPRLQRKAFTKHIKDCLVEEQKFWAEAGNATGKRYTPFQDTKEQLLRMVKEKPGLPMKDLIAKIQHHYCSDKTACSCILQWIHKGIITGIELRQEGRRYLCYPTINVNK